MGSLTASPFGSPSQALRGHAGILAELESTAWKDDRRFRIMTVDGGAFSFADLHFQTPSKPRTPGILPYGPYSPGVHNVSIVGADPSRAVGTHFVLITSPPDGRYAASEAGTQAPPGADGISVRALILPAWSGVMAQPGKVSLGADGVSMLSCYGAMPEDAGVAVAAHRYSSGLNGCIGLTSNLS